VVKNCAIHTEARKSRLDLVGFGNGLYNALRMNRIIRRRQSLSVVNFGALRILYSKIRGMC